MNTKFLNVKYTIEDLEPDEFRNIQISDIKEVIYTTNGTFIDQKFHEIEIDLDKYESVFHFSFLKLLVSEQTIPPHVNFKTLYKLRLSDITACEMFFPVIYENIIQDHNAFYHIFKTLTGNRKVFEYIKDIFGFCFIYLSQILDKVLTSSEASVILKRNDKFVLTSARDVSYDDIRLMSDINSAILNLFFKKCKNKSLVLELASILETTVYFLLSKKLKNERSKFYLLSMIDRLNELFS